MLTYLTENNIVVIHRSFLDHSALRDPALLSAAVARPRAKAHYEQADLATQAAALIQAIAQAHAFVDANKRTALASGLVFLFLNGYRCWYTGDPADDELGKLVVAFVIHQVTIEDVTRWLSQHLQDSPTQWPFDTALRHILADYAASFTYLEDK